MTSNKINGLGPNAWSTHGDHGFVPNQLLPSYRELDFEFYRCPPRLKVNRTSRCASWPLCPSHGVEESIDLLLQVDYRYHVSWFPNLAWMRCWMNWWFNSWTWLNCIYYSKNDSSFAKINPMWGTSMNWSSFTTSLSIV